MLGPRFAVVVGVAISSLLAIWQAARAGYYRDPDRHYSVDIPTGWTLMSADELSRINKLANNKSSSVTFSQGFRPVNGTLGNCPYVLIQHGDTKINSSYEEIEASLARDFKTEFKKLEGTLSDVAKNISVGDAVFDRAHNRVFVRMHANVIGAGSMQTLSVGNLGSEGFVWLHSYAHSEDFSKHVPTFEKMNDTFKFDKGYTFTPSSGVWPRVGLGGLLGGAKGGLIGAVVGVVVVLIIGGVVLVVNLAKKASPGPAEYYGEQPPSAESDFKEY